MKVEAHIVHDKRIAEILSDSRLIGTAEDGLNLLGTLYYQDFDRIIVYEKNIAPEFFDLKNGMAGEILQKFSTYRVRLAIVGDFASYPGKSLQDFIRESNRTGHISFVDTLEKALAALSHG